MKHNKLLIGLLSTGIVASAIPALSITSCGCSKTETKEWRIDDSLVSKTNIGYVESTESYQGACFITGFKLTDDFLVSDLSVEVTNLKDITDTTVSAEIEEIGYNYFTVNVYFTSKNLMAGQKAAFDLVIKNSSDKSSKFVGFTVTTFSNTPAIRYDGDHRPIIGTLTDGKNFEYVFSDYFYEYTQEIKNADLKISIESPSGEAISGIKAEILNRQGDYFNVKLTFGDLNQFNDRLLALRFTNADHPEWNSLLFFQFTIETDINKIFECTVDEESKTAKLFECHSSDKIVEIPETITINGTEYKITKLDANLRFANTNQVEKIIVGDNVVDVPVNSIQKIQSLKEVKFGKNVNIVSSTITCPLSMCPNLETIVVDEENKFIKSIDSKCLVKNTGTEAEPKFDTLIRATNLTTSIPNTITTINKYAFSYLLNIASISIPDSVKTINSYAFLGCLSLQSVTFEGTSQISILPSAVFSNCVSLTNITIPASVTKIEPSAFHTCGLQQLTLPSALQTIGANAFFGCAALQGKITIPASVTEIERNPFGGCISVTDFFVESGNTKYYSKVDGFDECHCIMTKNTDFDFNVIISGTDTTIAPTRATVGGSAFASMLNLTSFDFANVIGVDNNAFNGCEALSTLTNLDKVSMIGDSAFKDCKSIQSVTLPNVYQIEKFSFDGCSKLYTVSFENNTRVTEIPEYAFRNCKSLNKITLCDTITEIGESAFENCAKLEKITIPAKVKTIYKNAFKNCIKLKTVTFAEDSELDEIGESAFENNITLQTITIPIFVRYIQENAFKNCISLVAAFFKDSNNWKTTERIIDPATIGDPASAAEILLDAKPLIHKSY